jgi:hypothetical protein
MVSRQLLELPGICDMNSSKHSENQLIPVLVSSPIVIPLFIFRFIFFIIYCDM